MDMNIYDFFNYINLEKDIESERALQRAMNK
jgi:hypothetical protein